MRARQPYLDSVLTLIMGWSSRPCSTLSRLRSHSSSLVSSEKSASTAPDRVPVTTRGAAPCDQAKAAVRGISLSRTMTTMRCVREGKGVGLVMRDVPPFCSPIYRTNTRKVAIKLKITPEHQEPYGEELLGREGKCWRRIQVSGTGLSVMPDHTNSPAG